MEEQNIIPLEQEINKDEKEKTTETEFISNLPEWDLLPPLEGVERNINNDIL